MPDVIIEGMEMPESCKGCQISQTGLFYRWCGIDIPGISNDVEGYTDSRPDRCPLHPAPEWISVEKRLPTEEWKYRPKNTDIWPCMVYRRAFNYPDKKYVTKAYFDGECFVDLENTVLDRYVTHWMPLPEPPKKSGTGDENE